MADDEAPASLPAETDEYIRESIESALGLQISSQGMMKKLIASEEARRRVQDQVFALEELLRDAHRRLSHCRAEASMNAQGLKKCIEEKEMMASQYNKLVAHCSDLEKECVLYEKDLAGLREICEELEKDNADLRSRLKDSSAYVKLANEVEALKNDKEILCSNLAKAEAEVSKLFEVNKVLDEENKRLISTLVKERRRVGSTSRSPATVSATGKRKANLTDSSPRRSIDPNAAEGRQPLSPLHLNLDAEVRKS